MDDNDRKELVVGLVDRTVKVYNTKLKAFTQETKVVEDQDSPLVGLSSINEG